MTSVNPAIFARIPAYESIVESSAPAYFSSPAYEIKNFDKTMNPFQIAGALTLGLFKPNNINNGWQRAKRHYRSKFYIIANDKWDLLLLASMVITFIITLVVLFRSHSLNVIQVYKFNNEEDAKDPIKQAQLDKWNSTFKDEIWISARAGLASIPIIIALWNMFKRTTIPNKLNKPASLYEIQNRASRDLLREE